MQHINAMMLSALVLGGAAWLSACQKSEDKASAASAEEKEPFGRLTIEDMDARIKAATEGREKVYIYDNNTEDRYKQSRLPGAKWVNYRDVKAEDLPPEKDATLVFYCANEH